MQDDDGWQRLTVRQRGSSTVMKCAAISGGSSVERSEDAKELLELGGVVELCWGERLEWLEVQTVERGGYVSAWCRVLCWVVVGLVRGFDGAAAAGVAVGGARVEELVAVMSVCE
ncbi:hypothetical protein VNO80_00342 [Phaseolus coccineus]|uniref:Uncharacterized protein n=1 Tax=Phaseolus coccineus TaxID=3886 RepID=A0AAN9NYL4_PHACN